MSHIHAQSAPIQLSFSRRPLVLEPERGQDLVVLFFKFFMAIKTAGMREGFITHLAHIVIRLFSCVFYTVKF